MLEKEIESRMVKLVRKRGGKFYKFVSPSNTGVPDRIFVKKPGVVIFVELKREGKAPTPRQKYVHREMRNYGLDVRVVIGLKQAMEFVEEVFPDAEL